MIRAGIADVPDRYQSITHTDDNGKFDFGGVPFLTLNVYVEKKHFCWERHMQTVVLERLKLKTSVSFE